MPGEANLAAEPRATAVPAVQPAVLKSLTVVPAAAEPFTSGALSLAGELGSVSVIRGAGGAWVSTVNDRHTIWLSFPGASMAMTKKTWLPFESSGVVAGEPQGLKALASTRQTKVEPASFEVKEKLGVGSLVKPPWLGPAVMLAWGGVVSAVKPLNLE